MSHSKPNESFLRSIFEPASAATESSSCSRSLAARANSPADIGLKITAATPAVFSPSSTSSVTRAVDSSNRLSSETAAERLRPRRTSLSPKRPLQLASHDGQPSETLLERRMVGEQLVSARPDRDDEEGIRGRELP